MNIDASKVLSIAQERASAKTKLSAELFDQAKQFIPSGVTSNVRYSEPHPIFVREARGGRLWDVDGNEYIDCRLGFGPVLLGHAPEPVCSAVREALMTGTVYSLPHESEVDLARKVTEVVPGAEMATFCSSGSEATLHALRLARAFTGRKKIAKFEGGFHGIHDGVQVSVQYREGVGGPVGAPVGTVESPGIPEETLRNTLVLPFNHPAALDIISAKADELAAVIVEPVQGAAGSIPAQRAFLEELRQVTVSRGIVLIFDEVITGFRLALGGGQEYYGVQADLATFGKILGGGFPFGCVAGSRKIMRFISVPEARKAGRLPVVFGGTFNGNPTSVAAANALLDYLIEHRHLYAELNERGDRIRREVLAHATARGLDFAALGEGSLFSFRFVKPPVTSVRDLAHEDVALPQALFLLLLAKNVLIHPRHGFLCTAHSDSDVKRVIEAYQAALEEITAC